MSAWSGKNCRRSRRGNFFYDSTVRRVHFCECGNLVAEGRICRFCGRKHKAERSRTP